MNDREEEWRKLEEEERSRWDLKDKRNWRFNLGKKRWGFWVLVIGFILFLITQLIIRPMIGGG